MASSSDPSDERSDGPPAPMPPGELREDAALQVQDLLVPTAPPVSPAGWEELFDAWDSSELLGRLVDGDPLSLRTRVLRTCRENAWMLHADRALMRALALCAYKAQLYTGSPPLERWCDELVARACRDLLHEDLEHEFDGRLLLAEEEIRYRLFGELFGIEPPLCRRASVRFHQASKPARRVVWRIALEGRPITVAAELEGITTAEAEGHVRAALTAMASPRNFDWNDLADEEDFG